MTSTPDFFEVNEALKRPEDKTVWDSFKWLSDEAKRYHSVISVHINFNDAYVNAPSFNNFISSGALIKKKNTLHINIPPETGYIIVFK